MMDCVMLEFNHTSGGMPGQLAATHTGWDSAWLAQAQQCRAKRIRASVRYITPDIPMRTVADHI
jgi:hypothetical protein